MSMALADFPLPDAMDLRSTEQPLVSNAEFRTAMSSMASTVSIVTASHDGQVLGRTATAVMSLAATPPSVLVSIDIESRLADLMAKSGRFSLAMLAQDQAVIGDVFAGKLGDMDRFTFGIWGQWPSGNPQLYGAVTTLDCEIIGSIETGTHVLFAGGIIEVETIASKSPLLWHRHGYHRVGGVD